MAACIRHTGSGLSMYMRQFYSGFGRFIRNIPSSHHNGINTVKSCRWYSQNVVDSTLERLSFEVRRSGRIRKRELKNLLDMLKQQKKGTLSSHQASTVVRMFGSSIMEERYDKRAGLMHEVWQVLENSGAPLDISHYNTLLKLYVDSAYDFAPTDFLSMLEKKGVEPNRVTHQRLLSRYCQEGNLDGALKVLEFMKEKDMPINALVFNSLITGHLKAKDVENAKGIITMMEQQEVEVSNDTYRALLCGLAELGDLKSFDEALKQCDERGVILKDKDYLDVIVALSTAGTSDKMEEMISKLKKGFGYNNEAVNTVIRLVNAGKYEDGYKILKTMSRPNSPSGEVLPTGGFFIKQLVSAEAPLETILEWCRHLRSSEEHPYSFHVALHSAFLSDDFDRATQLIDAFINDNISVRPQYFWPFLAQYRKDANEEAVLETLRKMMALGAQVNYQTLYDYVYPALTGTSDQKVEKLRNSVTVTSDNAVVPLVIHLLQVGQVAEAADVVIRYNVMVGPIEAAVCRRLLVPRIAKGNGLREACTLLRHFGHHTPDLAKITNGQLVIDVIKQAGQDKQKVALMLLNNMVESSLPISEISGRIIENTLGELTTPAIKEALGRLTGMEYQSAKSDMPEGERKSMFNSDVMALEEELARMKAAGKPVRGLARTLFIHYNRNWNLIKVEEMKKELDALNMEFPIGDLALLLATYAENGKVNEALQCKEEIRKRDPNTHIDSSKILRLVVALVNDGQLDAGIKMIEEDLKSRKMQETTRFTMSLCIRLLEAVSQSKDVEALQKVFKLLQDREFIANEQPMLAQLVRIHVLRNDLQSAVNKYEEISKSHNTTPYQVELMKALIGCESTDLLQKVIDLSTEIHGEMNTLHDLAFAFLESGNLQQSKRVFETPGLRARNTRFEYFCQNYVNNDQPQTLENLLKVTKNLFDIDRNMLYNFLLKSYCKVSDVDSALGIWTSIQEEDLDPSVDFLIYLADFLERNGRQVPFTIPEATTAKPSRTTAKAPLASGPSVSENPDNLLRNLAVEGKYGNAMDLVREQLQNKNPISPKILKLFVTRLGVNGAFNYMEELSAHFTEDEKRSLSFNGNLISSYVHARKPDEAMEKLENWLKNKPGKEWNFNTFPVRGVITLLESYPEKYSGCLEVANEYSNQGFFGPLNTLWIYSFLNRNFEEADRLWNHCLKDAQDLLFRAVLDRIWEKKDVDLAQRFTPTLIEAVVPEESKISAFNRLSFACVRALNYDAAVDVLQKGISSQQMSEQDISPKLMTELEKLSQGAGKAVPFKRSRVTAETMSPS